MTDREAWREEVRQKVEQHIKAEQLDDAMLGAITGGLRLHEQYTCTNRAISESMFVRMLGHFGRCGSFMGHDMFNSHKHLTHCSYCDYFESR